MVPDPPVASAGTQPAGETLTVADVTPAAPPPPANPIRPRIADRSPGTRRIAWFVGLLVAGVVGAFGGVMAVTASRGLVEPAIFLPHGGEAPIGGITQVATVSAPVSSPLAAGGVSATATPLAAQPTAAALATAPPPTSTKVPAAVATAIATPVPPTATVPSTATATATKPPPTPIPSARISGYFRVGQAGGLCGGCVVRFSGPITFDSIAGNDGRFSAGFGVPIPPGTYKVFYECRGAYIPVNQPQTITLVSGNNTFDVVIGFCG